VFRLRRLLGLRRLFCLQQLLGLCGNQSLCRGMRRAPPGRRGSVWGLRGVRRLQSLRGGMRRVQSLRGGMRRVQSLRGDMQSLQSLCGSLRGVRRMWRVWCLQSVWGSACARPDQ